jgi:hypothetical protein
VWRECVWRECVSVCGVDEVSVEGVGVVWSDCASVEEAVCVEAVSGVS